MKNNIINLEKLNNLRRKIEDNVNSLNETINGIDELVDLLAINFDEENNKKNCDYIKDNQLTNLKKLCNQMQTYQLILSKFGTAYLNEDDNFSNEKIL